MPSTSNLEDELTRRVSYGISGKMTAARKKAGVPGIFSRGEHHATFVAYMVGPTELDGQVGINKGTLLRFVTTRLRDRVAADRDGIVIQGLIESSESWPSELVLTYRCPTGARQVTLQKAFSEEEMPSGYRGVLGTMKLNDRSMVLSVPAIKAVKVRPTDRDLIVGIQKDLNSGQTVYFVMPPPSQTGGSDASGAAD